MNRPAAAVCVLLSAVLMSVSGCATSTPPEGKIAGYSALSWEATTEAVTVTQDYAYRTACRVLGVLPDADLTVQLVRFSDRSHPIPELRSRVCWMFCCAELPVDPPKRLGGGQVFVPLTICIDATDGLFVCAFTPAKKWWDTPSTKTPPKPEDRAASLRAVASGWSGGTTAKAPKLPQATLRSLVAHMRYGQGADPRNAGQLVLRFLVATRSWQRQVITMDGKTVTRPYDPEMWIAEYLSGYKIEHSHPALGWVDPIITTSMVDVYQDGILDYIGGACAP